VKTRLQPWRKTFQLGLFALFILAPPLDLLRMDLQQGHAVLLGRSWTLGIDDFLAGHGSTLDAAINLVLRGFLPLFGAGVLLLWVAWYYGRLYCGWACPHFSVVEWLNTLMTRASGRPTLWQSKPLRQPDGKRVKPNRWYWAPVVLLALGMAFLWSVVFLTYLLPPGEIYNNLLTAQLTWRQGLFIGVSALILSIDFVFARHLFCRYACSVGLFQSLVWMANPRALVIKFDKTQAVRCSDCNLACENVCPMRLKPRANKRKIYSCTECGLCIDACKQVNGGAGLLSWAAGEQVVPLSAIGGLKCPPRPARPAKETS